MARALGAGLAELWESPGLCGLAQHRAGICGLEWHEMMLKIRVNLNQLQRPALPEPPLYLQCESKSTAGLAWVLAALCRL